MKILKSFCFICGEIKPTRVVYNKDSICIIRCCGCQTLFRPKEEHNRFKPVDNTLEYYTESIRCVSGNRLFFRLVFGNLIKKFPYIKNGNFLDLGCGVGNSLLEAKQLGFNVFGIDSSRWVVNYCKKFGFEIITSLDNLARKQIKFDVVNLNQVLEHISDPIDLLSKLKEFLKEDGILRIEVPDCNKFFIWKFIPRCKYIITKPSADHIYYYTTKTLRNIIAKAGLEIIDIHTEGFGNYIRHKATMLNPDTSVRIFSTFLYLTHIEEILNLKSFLIVIAKKRMKNKGIVYPLTNT